MRPDAVRAARRRLRSLARGFDVVHAHGLRAGAIATARPRGIPLVVTWHNAPLTTGPFRVAHAALSGYVARAADLTLGASADLTEAALHAGARVARTTFVVAPPLAPSHRSRAEVRTELAVGGRPLLLAVGRLPAPTRFVTDILLSAPSIVVGLFVYEVMVISMGHFSAWAGALALGIIVIPVVVRTTEEMLRLVPDSLREAAVGLGAPRWKVVFLICYRAAQQGMVTGVLLAIARISGETAPLLFTALNNQFWSLNLNAPVASLPVIIFQFALSPYADWQKLAWTGALIITLAVLALSIIARFLSAQRKTS